MYLNIVDKYVRYNLFKTKLVDKFRQLKPNLIFNLNEFRQLKPNPIFNFYISSRPSFKFKQGFIL